MGATGGRNDRSGSNGIRDERLPQLHMPVVGTKERCPIGVAIIGHFDAWIRMVARLAGGAQKRKIGLRRSSPPLSHIAGDTGTYDVLPTRRTALRSRNNVVHAQVRYTELSAAILAGVTVSREQIATIELDLPSWHPGECKHSNNTRHRQIPTHRPYPIMGVGFLQSL